MRCLGCHGECEIKYLSVPHLESHRPHSTNFPQCMRVCVDAICVSCVITLLIVKDLYLRAVQRAYLVFIVSVNPSRQLHVISINRCKGIVLSAPRLNCFIHPTQIGAKALLCRTLQLHSNLLHIGASDTQRAPTTD